ncbi:hypothetical protein [Methanosarcina mazei]|jgi:hypothetical protein|uniref:hypothetical protein n=1 Tax=Methanosarcina mazei TaxID=2209 RepID=UPI00064EA2AC|nr:hypothetical protein [Methanosarcina mazei]
MKQEQENKDIIEEMKKYLPIPASIKKKSYQFLMQQEGANPNLKQEVTIIDVFDSGDVGGILCVINGNKDKAIFISLTHLIIKKGCPLSDKIAAYQRKRIRRLQRYG